jgi:Protein of unknown function (DUF4238)
MWGEYRKNHYVPEWYQKRFIPSEARDRELFYLNLAPGTLTDSRGVVHQRKAIRRLGLKRCFFQEDLYTAKLASIDSTEIERLFFGSIDSNGRHAVEHFTEFEHMKPGQHEAIQALMMYMSTQKLRTPKGLNWLSEKVKTGNRNIILQEMMRLRQLFCAAWMESVWLVADAVASKTKFIVSDHPVTVYNRRCGPRSQWCRGDNDPEIWLNATHTVFPLCLDHILILTNLSWVRNPYQSPTQTRPNPNPFRSAMFSMLDIQTDRHLCEDEVRQINFVIKSRARRYVAAGKEEWLYPETYVSKSDWAQYGHGYLFMPDPRSIRFTREILMGFRDGTATAFDEYGRRPWDPDYKKPVKDSPDEWHTFLKFQGEFAWLFGRKRRGRASHGTGLDREEDSEDFHKYHLSLDKRRR